MCGIWFCLSKDELSSDYYKSFRSIRPRGPDVSRLITLARQGVHIGFHRLAVMGPTVKGDQPFIIELDDGKVIYVICNGEIYNFRELATKYSITLTTGSDCEILPHLFAKVGIEKLCHEVRGEFAFVICEIDKSGESTIYVARDSCGIRPLFISFTDESMCLSSETKGSPYLKTDKYHIDQFPPGSYMVIQNTQINKLKEIYPHICHKYRDLMKYETAIYDLEQAKQDVRKLLTRAVMKRMLADRQIGGYLSGGLDSTIVIGIIHRILKVADMMIDGNDITNDYDQFIERTMLDMHVSPQYMKKDIVTFSIGMEGSTDEVHARQANQYFGGRYYKLEMNDYEACSQIREHTGHRHYHVIVSQEDFINAVPEVIWAIESFDITTVRASVGQYLLAKWIARYTDIIVIMIGDGSDELCSGYKYFHKAPNAHESHLENVRLVTYIHYYDVLRADRGISSNGLEARVPFLDEDFVELYLSIDPTLRVPIEGREKWLLRESFRDVQIIPVTVLERPKEAFSDGVSSMQRSWYQIMQDYIETKYTDEELDSTRKTILHIPPTSKEALYYRRIFESYFGTGPVYNVIPFYWLPKWVGDIKEPSARVLEVYSSS